MIGVDRHTGQRISNFDSAVQSIEVIFTSRLGERVMRRHFGAGLAELLGRAITPSLFSAWRVLIAVGIDLWEPRFRVRAVEIKARATELQLGTADIKVVVDWRPNALRGDFSVADQRSFSINLGRHFSIQ